MQFLKITADDVAQLDVLEVVPAALVPRIEIRRVTRQRPTRILPRGPPRTPSPPPAGGWANDPKSPARSLIRRPRCSRNSISTPVRVLTDQGADPAVGRQAAHDREVVARLPLVDHWRPALWRIRLDHAGQQIEPRLIHENQHPRLPGAPLRTSARRRSPPCDRRLVALDGPTNRHLRRPAEFLEEAADVTCDNGRRTPPR